MSSTMEASTIGADSALILHAKWNVIGGNRSFRCAVCLVAEPEGGFSVFAKDLPGAVSQGETAAVAVENIREALRGLLASYIEDRGTVPWQPDWQEVPAGAQIKHLRIDV